jgi:hypothetical protein
MINNVVIVAVVAVIVPKLPKAEATAMLCFRQQHFIGWDGDTLGVSYLFFSGAVDYLVPGFDGVVGGS